MSPALWVSPSPQAGGSCRLCWGLWSWDRQRWPALAAPSRSTECKVLGPQWQSQSERELNKKAGTAIGKLKAREFREPSRGDLKPEEAAFHSRFPLPERKLLGTQPGLTSTQVGLVVTTVKIRREAAATLRDAWKQKCREQQILPGASQQFTWL